MGRAAVVSIPARAIRVVSRRGPCGRWAAGSRALCHYPRLSQNVSGMRLRIEAVRDWG